MCSALLGGVVAVASGNTDRCRTPSQRRPTAASRRPADAAKHTAPRKKGPRPPRAGLLRSYGSGSPLAPEEFSQDEQVNISVYENVNRSVVNITTRGAGEGFFLMEVPTEGAGSGSILDKAGHVADELPRHRRRPAGPGHAVRRQDRTKPASSAPTRSTTWPCIKIDAPAESLHPVRLRRLARSLKVGHAGVRHRQSVRAGADADDGHHLQSQPLGPADPRTTARSSRSSRSTRRSIPAIRAGRCWIATGA